MHALNNALGFHFFDADDLQKAANIYMLEDGYDMNDSVDAHVRADGWYSSEVLAMALRSTAMQKKIVSVGNFNWPHFVIASVCKNRSGRFRTAGTATG